MRGRRHKLQVSTFPFLAVLLCAMGSLILILLVMDRKAHRAAQVRAQREAERLVEESARSAAARQAEREQRQQQARAAWQQKRDALHNKLSREQIEMQLQMRKLREQLQEIAARLHYEQDTSTQLRRQVQSEHDRLQAEEQLLRTLRGRAHQAEDQSKESNKTLRRMTIDLLQMEQALKDLKAARQRERHTFSVVPYHGRRGENRRPLYVECTADNVIFHPGRKAMPIDALLPGSDASGDVRAEVERRIARQRQKLAGSTDGEDALPYLLLLLRPSGVRTYHVFQAALKGLPLDFGYEFIDDDWVLDFPADDEMPNSQPWMVATKTPNRPTPAAPAATSPSPTTSGHPIALAPMNNAGGGAAGGIRGFRASETGGAGNWVRKTANQMGSPLASGEQGHPRGAAGGAMGMSPSVRGLPVRGGGQVGGGSGAREGLGGGTGQSGGPGSGSGGSSALAGGEQGHPGGAAGGVGMSSSVRGLPGKGGGKGNGFGGAMGWAGNSRGSPGGSSNGQLTNRFGAASSSSGPGTETGTEGSERGVGLSRGNGRGHPAALAPSFGDGGDGIGYSGNGGPSGGGYRGTGAFGLRGSGSGAGYGSGSSMGGSPNGSGSGLAGLGPPRALLPNSQGTGSPGNALGAATAGQQSSAPLPNDRGSEGRYVIARGSNGGNGSGSALNSGAVAGTAMPGASGGSGSPTGTQINKGYGTSPLSGGRPSSDIGVSQGADASRSGVPSGSSNGSNRGTQGSNGSSSGAQTAQEGSPRASTSGGASSSTNGRRSSGTVIYLDPLTGKPTTIPPSASQTNGNAGEEPPSEETDGKRDGPRIRVFMGNGGGSGQPADPQAEAVNRIAPTPSFARPRHRSAAPRPAWVHGGRDWIIYVECRADDLLLYPSQRTFTIAQASDNSADNPLLKAIQKMIDRRQALRRHGEPPYRPQLCLLVRPDYLRTFLTVYPALEALPVPKTRRNLDDEDDVIGIVTGTVP